ncbi:hypothetical protein E9536_37205 [Burkholderia sp. LS-044]|nr:hypothetical protein E9536_37205 [Burkholderia sp. LS-044]
MPEIARMAASLVACLARPSGAPHSLPYERFRAFACAFHMETGPSPVRVRASDRRARTRRACRRCRARTRSP